MMAVPAMRDLEFVGVAQPPSGRSRRPAGVRVSRPPARATRSTGNVTPRMRERVDALIAGFSGYLGTFAASDALAGPSVYFHRRTIELLRTHPSPLGALDDRQYLDALYATLAVSGLHRPGPRGARLCSMDELRERFAAQRSAIALIQRLELHRLSESEVGDVADHLGSIVAGLTVGDGTPQIVAGSKALHHLLPALVPPIDRHSTLRFFSGNAAQGDPARVFATIFPRFREIALACTEPIADALAHPTSPLDTSATKMIDNAIAGFCIGELGE